MTLPVSGAISFNAINVELGVSGTTQASLGQSSYRTLAGVPSGAISMNNFYGKSNAFLYTISSSTNNLNLRSGALAAGWDGSLKVQATINSGVVISSTSTGSYALTIDGTWPNGVELTNNGVIVGRGGNGGSGAGSNPFPNSGLYGGSPGSGGGPALTVSSAVTINNTSGIIGGGGGGGGGGKCWSSNFGKGFGTFTGGGGGGGITSGNGGTGGYGGSWGFADASPGGAGTLTSAGGGGYGNGGSGGDGGSYGSSGATGGSTGSGNRANAGPYPGGSAGAAIVGNSNITYAGNGTINGSVS